jgi:hypothetical protein
MQRKKYEGMKKARPYEPLGVSSDRYYDLLDALVPVFERHFSHCKNFRARWEADRFLSTYDSWMTDFWAGDQARKELDKLEKALRNSIEAYNALPVAVRDDLHGNAQQWDYFSQDRYLASTKRDFIFKSEIPHSEAETVSTGLKAFAKSPDDFFQAIEVTRQRIPEGIPTRNRDIQKWALIQSSVELVRTYNAFNVPHDVDTSGDMARLLSAVFDVFGIRVNSFRQLYASVREHLDSKRGNLDLLSIDD